MLRHQIQRAASHPLFVAWKCTQILPPSNTVLNVLMSSSARWVGAHLCYKDLSPPNELEGFLPLLQSVSIREMDAAIIATAPRSTFLRNAPRLVHIAASHVVLAKLELPWSQITKISTTIPSSYNSGILEDLGRATALHSAKLYCICSRSPPSRTLATPTLLSHLCTLALKLADPEGRLVNTFSELLNHVTLPRLASLNIDGPFDVDCILSLQQRSQNSLLDLRLTSPSIKESDCLRLLGAHPTLQALALACPHVYTETFLEKLSSSHLLPALRTIALSGPPSFSVDGTVEMMTRRGFVYIREEKIGETKIIKAWNKS